MIHLFCGYDSREAVGWHTFVASVLRRASRPVAIHRLDACGLPQGTNAFTFSRFLVPSLCDFKGHAIFADASDMLMLGDLAELDDLFDPSLAVQVVQHDNYNTLHPRKYVGTSMECENRNYARKNWASLMLMNCAHSFWRPLTHNILSNTAGLSLLQFGGLRTEDGRAGKRELGSLPRCWNVLADEGQDINGAKLLHWTAGIPAFAHYANAPGADVWRAELQLMMELA